MRVMNAMMDDGITEPDDTQDENTIQQYGTEQQGMT